MAFSRQWINKSGTGIYYAWRNMRRRCFDEKDDSWDRYGGRGISVCKDWADDYDAFHSWAIENGYAVGLTIDRVNGDGNYSPRNCRWVTMEIQQNNKANNVLIEHNGINLTIAQWANKLGVSVNTSHKRWSKYGAREFDDIFYKGNLHAKRTSERKNLCLVCSRVDSVKWRKQGKLCNTCYHRALRWSKKTSYDIEPFPEWTDIIGYAKLIEETLNDE